MKFSLIVLPFIGQASAWWGTGHLMVTRIAYETLSKQNPTVLAKVNSILAALPKTHASLVKDEGSYPFVECATWADDIKGNGGAFQSSWHFVDTPFLDEGGSLSDYTFKVDTVDVVDAMNAIADWIEKKNGYQNNSYYKNLMSAWGGLTADEGLSAAVRLLLHYAGDIHQPLHAESRVNPEYPSGDRGGNSFYLPAKNTASNLHAVYDSVFYSMAGYPTLPMHASDWSAQATVAHKLMSTYPESSFGTKSTDMKFADWAKDSFSIVQSFTYGEINHHEKQALPADYVANGKTATEKQLALAGYRVKNLMISLFNNRLEEDPLFLQ